MREQRIRSLLRQLKGHVTWKEKTYVQTSISTTVNGLLSIKFKTKHYVDDIIKRERFLLKINLIKILKFYFLIHCCENTDY